ncbi:protein of unknown function [Candidatus Methylocalor cossyra]|uniref:Uncharacterized protein n=1 Tax=Candidatus Methylocalor cossyra TaxID=3108543 RepID=A0ABM9NMD9_9GAMM
MRGRYGHATMDEVTSPVPSHSAI